MIELAFKNILKRRTRTILTILGVITAIQLYILMINIVDSFDKDIKKQVSGMEGRILVQKISDEGITFPPLNSIVSYDEIKALNDMKGINIERSSAVLFKTILPPIGPNMPPAVCAVGIEPGKELAFLGNLDKVEGTTSLKGDYDVILGTNSAKQYNAKLGDSIEVKQTKFKVVGIVPEMNRLVDGSFIIPLTTCQKVFGLDGIVSGAMITVNKAQKPELLAETIQKEHTDLAAATSNDIGKSIELLLKTQNTFFAMINNTALAIAAIVILIVMVMSVFERKKDIGTLKAIGASKGKILGMIIFESLIYSVIGALLAVPISMIVNGLAFSSWDFNILELLPQWIRIIFIAFVIGILGGLAPAWSAQRVSPLESLRYE